MLFNSYPFIFIFLPIVFAGMFWIGRYSHRLAALWLGLSSLAFYGSWNSAFIILLLTSICFNYGSGYLIGHHLSSKRQATARKTLGFAIALNLLLLGYFKYSNFFIDSLNELLGTHAGQLDIILPLGISFFTFTQIAYLVDVYRGIAREYNFIHYLLFVSYFPHLIAGPILHHKQMMPQFGNDATYKIDMNNVSAGLSIFVLGLAKKVLIADSLALYATPIFNAAETGMTIMLAEAWLGALAYTLQLYFDFSAYCDMAIGLSLMLNVRLPMNFNSPYKVSSIIDFWRCWHMTLSSFLRDYLYIPLGGNRKGKVRRYLNLMATMLLGGLWHGAGWTFVIWGGLHGVYLMINHAWRDLKRRLGWGEGGRLASVASIMFTFMVVVVAWVFFRAESFSGAWVMLSGMVGMNGISLPSSMAGKTTILAAINHTIVYEGWFPVTQLGINDVLKHLILALVIVWGFPNMREIFSRYQTTWDDLSGRLPEYHPGKPMQLLMWRGRTVTAILLGTLLAITLLFMLAGKPSEFLYFQF